MTPPPPPHRTLAAGQIHRNPGVYCKEPRSRRVKSGFTLIEILVTISIIALLVGLSAVGATVVARNAQEQRAKTMCQALVAVAEEHRNRRGVLPDPTSGPSSANSFVQACLGDEVLEPMLRAAIQKKDEGTLTTILDPWETELIYRANNDPSQGDYDNNLPTSRDPFFVSAGRDGVFGNDDDINSLEIGS